MKKVLVITNAKAGTLVASSDQSEPDRIRQRFLARGVDATVQGIEAPLLTETARRAASSGQWDLIVAGGGDGTLNAVASGLLGSDTPFGVLPLGTFNHLAKELEMPLSVEESVDALVDGQTVPFNVGSVNDRPFLLFAAIGLYAEMIRHRDAQRKSLGRRKMFAGAVALWKMLVRWRLTRVRVRTEEGVEFVRVTPTAYVSVSDYQIRALGVDVADSGPARDHLNVYLAATTRRGGLLGTMIRWCLRRVRPWADFELVRTHGVDLDVRSRIVRVGVDGEVFDLQPPLRCRLLEGAIKMRVPLKSTANAPPPTAQATGLSAY